MEAFNHISFLWLNAPADTPAWQLAAAAVLANGLIYLVPLWLTGLWLVGGGARRAAVSAVAAVAVALLVNAGIGQAFFHPRPFMVHFGTNFLPHAPDSSLPSDHTTIMLVTALVLLRAAEPLPRRSGRALLLLTLPTAWARIFLGVHWPLDIVAALLVAVSACLLAGSTPGRRLCGTLQTALEAIYRTVLARPIARGWLRP